MKEISPETTAITLRVVFLRDWYKAVFSAALRHPKDAGLVELAGNIAGVFMAYGLELPRE